MYIGLFMTKKLYVHTGLLSERERKLDKMI